MTASVSALVNTTALMGEFREPAGGTKSAEESTCWRRSGDAFRRNQLEPSGEIAAWACVRARAFMVPERTPAHWGQAQFHCGKPPPAAEPRTLTRILVRRKMTAGRGQGSTARRWRRS